MKTTAARFWAKVDRSAGPDACWPWTAAMSRSGYGRIGVGGRNRHAHRVALEIALGVTLRADQYACHRCDNRRCVNPAHLYIGTAATNARDAMERTPGFGWPHPRGSAHANARLTEDLVRTIRARYAAGDLSQRALARQLGLTRASVDNVLSGRRWAHV